MKSQKILFLTLSALGILIVLGYTYFVFTGFLRGPQIETLSPQSGFSTTSPLIIVSGRAVHTNILSLNDASVPLDRNGNFSESLLLAKGYNIISVKAEDKYNRVTENKIEIVFFPKEGPRQEIPNIINDNDLETGNALEKHLEFTN